MPVTADCCGDWPDCQEGILSTRLLPPKRQISLFPFCRIRKIIYLCPVFSSNRQMQTIQRESVIRTCMPKDCKQSLKGTTNVMM